MPPGCETCVPSWTDCVALGSADPGSAAAERLIQEFKKTNKSRWAVEDEIRDYERQRDFCPLFVELARTVYRTDDHRTEIKRESNLGAGSNIVEEKSYQVYQ